jgi:hypothetical protein
MILKDTLSVRFDHPDVQWTKFWKMTSTILKVVYYAWLFSGKHYFSQNLSYRRFLLKIPVLTPCILLEDFTIFLANQISWNFYQSFLLSRAPHHKNFEKFRKLEGPQTLFFTVAKFLQKPVSIGKVLRRESWHKFFFACYVFWILPNMITQDLKKVAVVRTLISEFKYFGANSNIK